MRFEGLQFAVELELSPTTVLTRTLQEERKTKSKVAVLLILLTVNLLQSAERKPAQTEPLIQCLHTKWRVIRSIVTPVAVKDGGWKKNRADYRVWTAPSCSFILLISVIAAVLVA